MKKMMVLIVLMAVMAAHGAEETNEFWTVSAVQTQRVVEVSIQWVSFQVNPKGKLEACVTLMKTTDAEPTPIQVVLKQAEVNAAFDAASLPMAKFKTALINMAEQVLKK